MNISTDELFVLLTERRDERRIAIPAPLDPIERARWQRGVAERKARGLGTLVGDDYLPRTEIR